MKFFIELLRMIKLSKEKLNKFKNLNGYTNKDIAELTGLQVCTVDRVFSGANNNPTLETLKALSELFKCSVDDFIDYDDNQIVEPYLLDKDSAEIATTITSNSKIKTLYEIAKKLSPDDLNFVIDFAKRLTNK